MKSSFSVLLAEDETALGIIVKETLESRGFEVLYCEDGNQALKAFEEHSPDILVLDVMMPKKDGFTLAQEIRLRDSEVPILFLTAKTQTKDVVQGFELGGNDYLKKPFSMEELIVRLRALLDRKRRNSGKKDIPIGNYRFNYIKQELSQGSQIDSLTHRESELLYHLSKNRNEVLERRFILKKLWGDDDFFNARSMDVFITKLRKKLRKDPNIQILNIRGVGYKLVC